MDKTDFKNYTLISNKGVFQLDKLICDRNWLVIKLISSGYNQNDAYAWAHLWVCNKYYKCVYDTSIMDNLMELEKILYV